MATSQLEQLGQAANSRLEHISGVIRVWLNPNAGYRDPYDWVATVRWIDCETVEIVGILKPPTPSIWRATKDELARHGAKTIIFYRIKGGRKIKKELTVKNHEDPQRVLSE
jgi:hypothetical protein